MPRDGSGVYSKPFPDVVDGTTIESAVYNGFVNDVALQLNGPVPVVAGGTGGASATTGLFNLSGEKAAQVVTDYGSHLWVPGSFRSAVAATGAPNATAAFSGVCYIGEALADPPTNNNVTVEARDASSGLLYIRRKVAGVWGGWASDTVKKNYVVNGAMMISQENGTTSGTTGGYFPADQWYMYHAHAGVSTLQQVASSTPGGSPNRIRMTATAADAAVAATDQLVISHKIEGLRFADLKFGLSTAKTVTIQFGVRAPAGTYGVSLHNSAANRSYIAEYVIAAGEANTDVVKSVTIPGDVTGTWAVDNGIGAAVRWVLMGGTNFHGAAGSWIGTGAVTSPNQFNFLGTGGNVFELFDVSLTEGASAPPFVVPDYANELLSCQRYFEAWPMQTGTYAPLATGHCTSATNGQVLTFFKTTKRAAPTLLSSAAGTFVVLGATGGLQALTALSLANVDLGSAALSFTSAGLAAGDATGLYRNGTNVAFAHFSARL